MGRRKASRTSAVESIYAAAVSPELWPDALAEVCDAIGADGGLIACHPRSSGGFLVTARLREDLSELYVKQYSANPFATASRRMPRAQPFLVNSIVDMNAVRRTSFHADIIQPQRIEGIIQSVHSSLSLSGGIGGFGFTLNVRQLDEAETVLDRLKPLLSHLDRGLEISFDIGRRLATCPALTDMVAAMAGTAFLLNEDGKVTFANDAAERLLAEDDGLVVRRAEGMQLSADNTQERAALVAAIKRSVQVARGFDAERTGPIRVNRRSGRPALVVLLTPLPAPFHPFGLAFRQTACILVQVLGGPTLSEAHAAAFGKLYGLTEAEARVAALIGSGHSAPQAAVILAVSTPTVKTHLSHCFDKTGVRTQVELARLMASMPGNRLSSG